MTLTSQVTMAWNGSELLIEAANPESGAREKITSVSFSDLPLEIQMTLRKNLSLAESHYARFQSQIEQAREVNRLAREREIAEVNRLAAIERDARWMKYLENVEPHVAAYHNAKRAARIAKSLETAKQIYGDIAETHGVELANKVIVPGRRPKRIEMTKNGNKVTYYPNTDDTDVTKAAKKRAKKNGAVIYAHIDTKSFVF